jgi:hypothetical protein
MKGYWLIAFALSSCASRPVAAPRAVAPAVDAGAPQPARATTPDADVVDASPPIVELATPELRELDQRIREHDLAGFELARRLGAEAVPLLLERRRDRERNIRHAATVFLTHVEGPGVTEGLMESTTDEDRSIATSAAHALIGRAKPDHLPDLLVLMRTARHASARGNLAKAVATIGGEKELREIGLQREREREPDTLIDFDVALARMADPAARERFVVRLTAAQEEPDRFDQAMAFVDLDYLGAKWVLPTLLLLLDDTAELRTLAPSGRYADSDVIRIRVCDYAVPAIERITGHDFKFKKRPYRPYSAAQIAQAKRFLRRYLTSPP